MGSPFKWVGKGEKKRYIVTRYLRVIDDLSSLLQHLNVITTTRSLNLQSIFMRLPKKIDSKQPGFLELLPNMLREKPIWIRHDHYPDKFYSQAPFEGVSQVTIHNKRSFLINFLKGATAVRPGRQEFHILYVSVA